MANDVFGIVGTTVVGAFQVEAVVAEGGFGVVYRAHHSGFRAKVALKCLKIPQYLSAQERDRFEAQFQAEAELLFKLSASIQTVVRPLHVEAVIAPDGSFMPFLAMEWLEGETLEAVAKTRADRKEPPFSLGELITLLGPVARALERAHHFEGPDGPLSIVHRDMKPENLLIAKVSGESIVKILDFGIASAKSMASQVAGRTSQRDGGDAVAPFTPAYGAPEQWVPKRFGQTGPWTDVWGLALTMVELLAGRHIVDGDHAAMMGTVLDPARRPTPRVEGVRVGDAVEAVFQRALALDPRDRFRDAGAFWNALLTAYDTDTEKRHSDPRMALAANRPPAGASVARAHAQIPDLEIGSPSRSGHYTAPASASQSGRFPATPPSRDGRELPVALDLPPQRSSSSSFAREAPSSDAGGESGGSGLELDSSPFTASEADIPTASSDPTGLSSPGAAPSAVPVSSVPPAESISPQLASAPAVPRTTVPSRFSNFDDEPGNLNRLVARFAAPAAMVAFGVLITIVDGAYAAAHGEVFTLGPLRLAWVAAALVLTGIGLSLYRFLGRPD